MNTWKKVKIGDFLTESKEESFDSDASKRITVRLNCNGVEQRSLKTEKEGATKYFIRHSGQFIYGKQNFHKGAFGIIPKELEGFTSSADLPAFDFINEICLNEYLNLWFQINERYKKFQKNVKGVGSQRLAVSIFLNQEIVLPDLETQKEIVKKVSVNLKTAEAITKEIESQKSYAKQLRQNILQEAIEGKLTAEWRKNHPVIKGNPDFDADALFEEIVAGKASSPSFAKGKTSKPLPPITDKEKPFEIPVGWKWVRLGEISEINPRNKLDDNLTVGFIPMPLISSQYGINASFEKRKWKDIKTGFTHFADNDVAVAKITPCFENSKATIFKNLPNGCGAGTTELFVIRPYIFLSDYLYINIKTNYFIEKGTLLMTGACGQKRLPREYVENFCISLPPLAEQEEIINKVEKLLNNVVELEQQISQREEYAKKLMQSVLRDAFAGR